MSQRILGIDLGARAVKAVLLDSTYRGFAVIEHGGALLPPPAEGATLLSRQLQALEALVAERGWKFQECVAALPGAGMTSSIVTLPFTEQRRIEQTIAFEAEGQVPFELTQVAWDWQSLGVRDGKSDVLVGMARKEELSALVAGLAAIGVDPRAVLPPATTYAGLLASGAAGPLADAVPARAAFESALEDGDGGGDGPSGPAAAEAILDLGQERTSLCIAVGGACVQARTFPFGAVPLARAVARDLGCTEEQALALLSAEARGAGLEPELANLGADPRAADALRRALAGLARELRATIRAWRARVGPRKLARLLLAGELGRLPGLPELLAGDVDGPVQPLVVEGPAAAIPAEDAPAYALALSLAIHGHLGARAPRLNLRRGDLAYTRDFEHLKGRFVKLAWAGAAVLLLAIASSSVKIAALSRQETLLDRALMDAEEKLIGKTYPNFEEAEAVLRGRGGGGAALPKASAVDLMAELSVRVPGDVQVRFEKMELTREKLHLEGTTDNAESIDRLVGAIKGSRCFADAKPGASRKRGDGKFEFSIDSGLTCLDSPAAGKKG